MIMLIFGILPKGITKSTTRIAIFIAVVIILSLCPYFISHYEIYPFGAALEATYESKSEIAQVKPLVGILWWNVAFIFASLSLFFKSKADTIGAN